MNDLDDLIGQSAPKLEARAKLTGSAVYTEDIYRPRLLHAALLGSPYPHARIISYDTTAARALRGVKAVITAEDLPANLIGHTFRDEPILARGKVRYMGEPVVAVAAESLEIARAAIRLVEVEFEELPAVFDAEEALADGAPILHDDLDHYARVVSSPSGGNMVAHIELETGNVDTAWDLCEVVVEGVYEVPAIQHVYMETCGALAEVDGSGKVTIWSSTQQIFGTQMAVALALDLPMSKVRCIAPAVGGGFGAKFITIEPITAALAFKTRRPVKLILPRDEDMISMRSRHAAKIIMKTGAMADGTFVARSTEIILNGGAYADFSPVVLEASVLLAAGPYRIPHVRNVGRAAYTNRLRAGAMRGFGVMQPTFAGESQIDEIAERLNLDPIELRIKNAKQSGDKNMGSHYLPVCRVGDCLASIRDHPEFIRAKSDHGVPGKRRGVGVSSIVQQSGLFSSSANVRLVEDGTLTVCTGYIDLGTGSDTALAQVAAATLGVDLESINIVAPDTDGAAYDYGTAADRGAHGVSESVHRAALVVKDRIVELTAEMLECATADVEVRPGGKVGLRGVPEVELSFADVAQRGLYAGGGPIIGQHAWYMQEQMIDPQATRALGFRMGGGVFYGFAATGIQVEVDEQTGQVEVLQAWHAADLGKVINPDGALGQLYGGVVQGISGALFEELVWDQGQLVNPSLMD
ncbi:MAG: xanthine dehydrogenase family protein molybdopterin-binding subunit [Proteobacteria bacterium]|nr:xanthine dehydrogenase family protein molybdopterin-binding subunit [Pseudomonadota bacterium]